MLYVITTASAVAVALLLGILAAHKATATGVRPLLVFTGGAALVAGFAVLVAFSSN